jgi:UDP-N-acetyl-D-galactosamine dehydrogenase
MQTQQLKLAIVGLGYVGLPLALEFAKKRPVIAFDISQKRIEELRNGIDVTKEASIEEILSLKDIIFTTHERDLEQCNCFIITVPTPVDKHKRPDLTPLLKASETVGRVLKPGGIVIYESTVYPGCTEQDCVPILEKYSGLTYKRSDFSIEHQNKDFDNNIFFCGYSPERINPGDRKHRLKNITKITSGSTPEVANVIDDLYSEIIIAGTYRAESIAVAEAAKVIENTQRDINIALINELAIIFNKMEIDTESVLKAAGTKWNFLPFRPGLVGGHCIGVDPYYLTHKAQEIGYHPEIILAGRRLNDSMASFVASQTVMALAKKKILVHSAKILILGLAFKENCPDLRNTKVIDIYNELKKYSCEVDLYDPWVDSREAMIEYNVTTLSNLESSKLYDAVIIAVGHDCFREMGVNVIKKLCKSNSVLFDLKYLFNSSDVDLRL